MLMMGKPTNTPPIDFRRCFPSIWHTLQFGHIYFCNMGNGLKSTICLTWSWCTDNLIWTSLVSSYVTICFIIKTWPRKNPVDPKQNLKNNVKLKKFDFQKWFCHWIISFWISFAAVARRSEGHWGKNNYSAFCSPCPWQFPCLALSLGVSSFWQKSITFYIIVTDI